MKFKNLCFLIFTLFLTMNHGIAQTQFWVDDFESSILSKNSRIDEKNGQQPIENMNPNPTITFIICQYGIYPITS